MCEIAWPTVVAIPTEQNIISAALEHCALHPFLVAYERQKTVTDSFTTPVIWRGKAVMMRNKAQGRAKVDTSQYIP